MHVTDKLVEVTNRKARKYTQIHTNLIEGSQKQKEIDYRQGPKGKHRNQTVKQTYSKIQTQNYKMRTEKAKTRVTKYYGS